MMKSQTVNEIFGSVVSVYQDKPLWVRYKIECTASWQTKQVKLQQIYEGNLRELSLDVDEEQRWYENGVEVPGLRGCEDVDLGVTPATNSLPIRRMKLKQGEKSFVRAAWVCFPELTIEQSIQRYRRLGKNVYEYSSETFTAELQVDDEGLVERYADIWEAIAKHVG